MFNNISIKARLVFLTVLLSLVSAGVGITGLVNLQATNTALGAVYNDRLLVLDRLSHILSLMQQNQNQLLRAALAGRADNGADVAEVEGRIGQITTLWNGYQGGRLSERETALAQRFIDSRAAFVAGALKPMIAALRTGDADGARALAGGTLNGLYLPAQRNMQALVQLQLTLSKAAYDAALERYADARNLACALVVLGCAGGALVAWLLIRGITASLAEALRLARSVAGGDLTQAVHIASRDEIGALLAALQQMTAGLSAIVTQVRAGTDTIATASSQIAAGNQDLAARTEQQAGALEETAASMGQLTSAVKQNADSALRANALAVAASGVAGRGGEVIRQVVDTMGGINDSAQRIAEIIGVIDGIAFQTNILALNAAVEAARAGEQGRGFAVVASEVRSLAQRSAAAAKEIKGLIESSVERVNAGGQLVEQAGATMREILASVREVTDIMGEITSASTEQTAGIEQVNVAVLEMDRVTQQNAALVEEAAGAAGALNEQAQRLAQAVGAFRVGHGAVPVPAPRRRALPA
jgi:methyl-accepting chemotaxis protein-1 (serine sensor receptor)